MGPKKGRDKEKEKEEAENCGGCARLVTESDKGVQCEICNKWYHSKCQDITEEAYKDISEMETLHWYCKICNASVEKSFAKIQSRIDGIELELRAEIKGVKDSNAQLAGEISKQAIKVDKVLAELRDELKRNAQETVILGNSLTKTKENIKKLEEIDNSNEGGGTKWADIVSKQVKVEMGNVKTQLESVKKSLTETKQHAEEEKEKELRRNNIIIHRSEESKEETSEGRNKDDSEFCFRLVSDILGVDCERSDLKRVIRLGKKQESVNRPVLLEFRSGTIKNSVMESLSKLRNASEEYKKLSVVHDMTKTERLECKELVQEAKKKEASDTSGEFIYRVRGSPGNCRIVKLKK